MPSPICKVNGTDASLGFVSVPASSTPTIALANTAGVNQWVVSCSSTDESTTAAAINATVVINLVAKTATFSAPGPGGSALIFVSTVNGGKDAQGRVDPTLTTTFKVCVDTPLGYQVAAFAEQLEHSPTHGYIAVLNNAIRNATNTSAAAGDGLYYFGGAYHVGAGDGSIVVTADAIRVGVLQSDASHGVRGGGSQHALATGLSAGFMSPAQHTLLAGATPLATPATLVLRDGTASATFEDARADRFLTQTAGSIVGSNSGATTNSVLYQSGQATAGPSGDVLFSSGAVTAGVGTASGACAVGSGSVTGGGAGGASGSVIVSSGASFGAFQSGPLTIKSGDTPSTVGSGGVTVSSGACTGLATSGTLSLASGTSPTASGSVALQSGASATTGTARLQSGNASAGASGAITVSSGTGTGGSGSITASTGSVSGGASGLISVSSGSGTSGSGSITVSSGSASAGASGGATISTGSGTTSSGTITVSSGTGGSASSGAISLITGGSTGSGGSGNVSIATGAVTIGAVGKIDISTGAGPATAGGQGWVTIRCGQTAGSTVGSVTITSGTSSVAVSSASAPGILLRTPNSAVNSHACPTILIKGGDASGASTTYSGSVVLTAGRQTVGTPSGYGVVLGYYDATDANYAPATIAALLGGGQNVIYLGAAVTAPTGVVPANAAVLWWDAASNTIKLRYGSTTRTVSTI